MQLSHSFIYFYNYYGVTIICQSTVAGAEDTTVEEFYFQIQSTRKSMSTNADAS